MELPQPRPYGTEGRKPTHDFLSLYSSHSSSGSHQDPRPPPRAQAGYLKTHDFLQPLEREDKISSKEDNTVEMTIIEKATPPAPPAPTSVEHTLPGGIGTYTISHISHFNSKIVPKPEGGAVFPVAQASSAERNDDNSNCSSYSGGGFTLWEESSVKKGTTGKENVGDPRSITGDPAVKLGQWKPERPSQSSSNHRVSFSPLSTSQVMTPKNQSFMDMIKSAKGPREVEVYDDEDFVIKQEGSFSSRGDLTVKVDGKRTDQKANTPQSKHSATEQRRRSKINDRFQALRDLIPHSDQKRDKASFLLEVIEYIQFLQEKVQKYEGPYQGWDNEPSKLVSLRNNLQNIERFADQGINSGASPALFIAAKLDENEAASPVMHSSLQKQGESSISLATILKAVDQYPGHLSNVATHPFPLQPSVFAPVVGNVAGIHFPHTPASDAHNLSQPQGQIWHSKSCKMESAAPSDKLKDQELTIEGGTISISSAYSQGLLDTLTQALHISGVDLSQASISVQIDIGKRATSKPPVSASIGNVDDFTSSNHGTTHSRVTSMCNEPDQAPKRLKTSKS